MEKRREDLKGGERERKKWVDRIKLEQIEKKNEKVRKRENKEITVGKIGTYIGVSCDFCRPKFEANFKGKASSLCTAGPG